MRILLSWLRDFVDLDVATSDVADTLGMRGFEVVSIDEHASDAAIDFDITANRPDCLSHAGMAREAATTWSRDLRAFGAPGALALAPLETGASDMIRVAIDNPDLCPRYAAAVADVTIGPSPRWLSDRLDAVGVRPINNVVDVTNYVLMDLGQPMHAFDLAKLAGAEIRVRRAKPGETLRTLDGQARTLTPGMLVIADAGRAHALAGVMGGADSEVSSATRTIVLESACFEPRSVRATSKQLGLKTEASARFERGADIGAPVTGLARACALLERIGAGRVRGPIVDVYPDPQPARRLNLRRERIAQLLGVHVPDEEVQRFLTGLGFALEAPAKRIRAISVGGDLPDSSDDSSEAGRDAWQVTVPTWRVDVLREADLIEEVGRHYGFDRLEPAFPASRVAAAAPDVRIARDNLLRRMLTAAGFSEAVCFAFLETGAMELFAPGADWADVVAIGNPLSAKFSVLRRSLLPGLIDAVAHNRRHGRPDVRLFEIGTRFSDDAGETRGVALVWTGAAADPHWTGTGRPVDFFDVKGVVERVGEALDVPIRFEPSTRPYLSSGQTAQVLAGTPPAAVGEVGRLVPTVADARGLSRADHVYVAELDLDALWYAHLDVQRVRETDAAQAQRPPDAFTPLPRYPSIVRDISILVDDRLPAESVRGTIAAAGPRALTDIREFDRYQGKGVPEGRVSLSLRLTFRSDERTLTDAEVQEAMDGILAALAREHQAVQR